MTTIIRSMEKIRALSLSLEEELEVLPDYNMWGDSNAEGKDELRAWLLELDAAMLGDVVDPWSEIGYWLTNEKSSLAKDYGLE